MLAYTSIYFYQHVPIHGFVLFFARNDNYLPMLDRINGPSRFNLSQPKVPDGSKRIPKLSSLLCSQFSHQEDFFHDSRALDEQTISYLKLFVIVVVLHCGLDSDQSYKLLGYKPLSMNVDGNHSNSPIC